MTTERLCKMKHTYKKMIEDIGFMDIGDGKNYYALFVENGKLAVCTSEVVITIDGEERLHFNWRDIPSGKITSTETIDQVYDRLGRGLLISNRDGTTSSRTELRLDNVLSSMGFEYIWYKQSSGDYCKSYTRWHGIFKDTDSGIIMRCEAYLYTLHDGTQTLQFEWFDNETDVDLKVVHTLDQVYEQLYDGYIVLADKHTKKYTVGLTVDLKVEVDLENEDLSGWGTDLQDEQTIAAQIAERYMKIGLNAVANIKKCNIWTTDVTNSCSNK